jgi:hypothetical protein
MNPVELVRGFLMDVWRLPLMFKLFLLCGAGASVWNWLKKQRQEETLAASAAWPVYRARVVWAQVTSGWRGKNDKDNSPWVGLLTYSYTVPGHELEVGEFRKKFYDEDEADAWARALRDSYVDVRVDPADPKRSVWQETPVVVAPIPVMDAALTQNPHGWGTREFAASGVFVIAGAGALVALWIQLSCLRGHPAITAAQNTTFFFGMHVGAIAMAIASGFVATRRGQLQKRSSWKSVDHSNSVVLKVLGAYYAIVFIYAWVRMAASDGEPGYWGVLMFSAGWLLFYVAAASQAWRAMQQLDDAVR